MLREWKDTLTKHGFEKSAQYPGTFIKGKEFLQSSVWESRDRNNKSKIGIFVAISFYDQFSDLQEYQTGIVGTLGTDNILVSDTGLKQWWDESEKEPALAAFTIHGLSWYKELNDLQKLIEYYEKSLHEGVKEQDPQLTGFVSQITKHFLQKHEGVASSRIRRPPIFHYFLSLLYYETGNIENACKEAELWLEHVKIGKHPSEPARTIRQLQQMRASGNVE